LESCQAHKTTQCPTHKRVTKQWVDSLVDVPPTSNQYLLNKPKM
jgi:hypothetical protein